MAKKTADNSKPDEPKTVSKLSAKILENIDVEMLTDSVAQQIGERIMANFAVSDLVDKLFQKYQQELQAQIIEAIIQRL